MTAFVLSLACICAYLISPVMGAAVTLGTVGYVSFKKGVRPLEKLIYLGVVTLPLYMTPVIPGLPPLFSWTTLFLICASGLVLTRQKVLSTTLIFGMFLLVGATSINSIESQQPAEFYYFVQIVLFIIPPVIFLEARRILPFELSTDFTQRALGTLAGTVIAMGVGVLIQWIAYNQLGLKLGYISLFKARTTFDLLIPAYSVLSGILSIGMVLGPIVWRRKSVLVGSILVVLSGVAILINSSRTGLAAGAVSLLLIILFPPRGVTKTSSRLAIIPAAGILYFFFQKMLNSSRFKSAGVLDANGRYETFEAGKDLLHGKIEHVLFGVGYSDYPTIPPHNFMLETLVCSGLISAVVIFWYVGKICWELRGTDWFFPLLSLLLSSLLFSGFYGVKAFPIVAIVCIAMKAYEDREIEIQQSDRRETTRSSRLLLS